jgi:hypothetical protein
VIKRDILQEEERVVREKKGGGSSQDEEERMGDGGVKVVRCTNRRGG